MTMLKTCLAALVALMIGAWAERAKADETFVCDGGRLVHARPSDIEHLKRTDPCVASYFGLTVVPVAAPVSAPVALSPPAAGPSVATTVTAALPLSLPSPVPALQPAGPSTTTSGSVIVLSSPAVVPPPPAPAKPPSDYRNVRVINGASGTGGWFTPGR